MSSIYSFAASVNAYDCLKDVFWGDMIDQIIKTLHGMWTYMEIFFWRKKKYAMHMI